MKKTSCFMLMMLATLLFMVISSTPAVASSFRTPKDTMEVLLDAARRADAHLWSTCLTDIDYKLYQLLIGGSREKDALYRKGLTERQYGYPIGENAYEFMMFDTVHDVTHGRRSREDPKTKAWFDMAYIHRELIWEDRYAEVILIMPADAGKGLDAPMTFYFLKERGQWKLFQWMTTELMLGWAVRDDIDYEDRISFSILVYTGQALDHRDCSHMKKREFPIPETVSNAYKALLDSSADAYSQSLLRSWLLTGDPKAIAYAEAKGQKGKAPAFFKMWLDFWAPCGAAKPAGPRKPMPLKYDTAEGWYKASWNNVAGLKQLPKRFPQDRPWRAKAHLQVVNRMIQYDNYEAALKEVDDLIWLYPDQKDVIAEAQKEKNNIEERIKRTAERNKQ